MFKGIIEEEGRVLGLNQKINLSVLTIKVKKILPGIRLGDSVAVNGACLTVTRKKSAELSFDVMKESLDKTNLGSLKKGQGVNLERAMRFNDRIDGHFVTGHVDAVCQVKRIVEQENYVKWQIGIPKGFGKYLVPKGSVCIDGVSLTVGEVSRSSFSIYLIPHTLEVTTFKDKREKDQLNVETDILAKYVVKGIKG